MSSPSWIFESLIPVLINVADLLVFVHGLRDWWANNWDRNQESLDKITEFRNLGRRGRRRPGEVLYKLIGTWISDLTGSLFLRKKTLKIWLLPRTTTQLISFIRYSMYLDSVCSLKFYRNFIKKRNLQQWVFLWKFTK